MTINLNQCQLNAEKQFIEFLKKPDQKEMVIEGPAGTGKSTLVNHLIRNMGNYKKICKALGIKFPQFKDIVLTATTRKAATVMSEITQTDPRTVHSYFGFVVRNNFSDGTTYLCTKNAQPRENVLLFVDEASFINEELRELIKDCSHNCKIVYMGDPYQLISVNSTQSPIFGNPEIPTATLKTVMRNNGYISKISSCYREAVKTNTFSPFEVDGKQVLHLETDDYQRHIDQAFLARNYTADVSHKVLAWTNARVHQYNSYITDLRGKDNYISVGETLITNKPIIDSKTSYILASTDTALKVTEVKPTICKNIEGFDVELNNSFVLFVPAEQWKVRALLQKLGKASDWATYFHIKDYWGDLRPAYASTVHKSQGSTYETVYVDLEDIGACNKPDEVARLLYVAVSRASKQVVLYGQLPTQYIGETQHVVSSAKQEVRQALSNRI